MEIKKDKTFRIINYTLMILLSLTCVGLFIYYLLIGDPNNRVLASFGVAILFVLPMLLELIFRCKFSNLLLLCYTIYAVLAGLIGCVFNVYNLTYWYDIFIHCLAGYVFCFIGLMLLGKLENYIKLKPWTVLLFCIFLSLATELVWELMEWFADNCLGQNSQGFAPTGQPAPLVTDTNLDMLCNFSGVVAFILHFLIGKFTKLNLGINYIENEFCGEKLVSRKSKKNKNVENNEIVEEMIIEEETVKDEAEELENQE